MKFLYCLLVLPLISLLFLFLAGRKLQDREIEFFIKSSQDGDGFIDLGSFANLLVSLKMYEKKVKSKEKKS